MNKPFVIGISGGSGSGKTLFLKCFLQHFTPTQVCLISQDNYYKPIEVQPVDENGLVNFDLPECIDDVCLLSDLQKLLSGNTIQKQEYTFNVAGHTASLLTINSAPIIILEGLFIFHFTKIASLLDMRIFLDADEEITLNRRLKRDLVERGYSRDKILYQWENHVLPAYNNYLLPYKESAEIVILNNAETPDEILEISSQISDSLKSRFFI